MPSLLGIFPGISVPGCSWSSSRGQRGAGGAGEAPGAGRRSRDCVALPHSARRWSARLRPPGRILQLCLTPKTPLGSPQTPHNTWDEQGWGVPHGRGFARHGGLRVEVPGVTPPQALVMDGGPQGGKCGVSCAGRGVGAGKAPPEVGPARGGGRGGVGAKEFLTFQQPGGVTAAGGGLRGIVPSMPGGEGGLSPGCPSGEVFGGKSWIFGGSLVPRGALDSQTGRSRSQR